MYKSALVKYLEETKFDHINKVWDAFGFCEGPDDVNRVIGEIPAKFGTFYAELIADVDGVSVLHDIDDYEELIEEDTFLCGFRVYNVYDDGDDGQEEEFYDFDWYD